MEPIRYTQTFNHPVRGALLATLSLSANSFQQLVRVPAVNVRAQSTPPKGIVRASSGLDHASPPGEVLSVCGRDIKTQRFRAPSRDCTWPRLVG